MGILASIIIWALLCQFDIPLMQARYAVLGDKAGGVLKHFMNSVREYGQTPSVIVIGIVIYVLDRRGKRLVLTLVVAELIGLALYQPGKVLIARHRPQGAVEQLGPPEMEDKVAALNHFTVRDTWIGWKPGNWDSKLQSFPSGHSAGAFVMTICLMRFYPPLGWLFLTLGIGCSLSRYLDAVHWLSDCWAGGCMGYFSARLALRLRPVAPRPASLVQPASVPSAGAD